VFATGDIPLNIEQRSTVQPTPSHKRVARAWWGDNQSPLGVVPLWCSHTVVRFLTNVKHNESGFIFVSPTPDGVSFFWRGRRETRCPMKYNTPQQCFSFLDVPKNLHNIFLS